MTLTFDWFLPTSGDGRTIIGRGHSLAAVSAAGGASGASAALAERPPDVEYLAQVAKTAEQVGFEAVLTPTGTWCEDAWLQAAAQRGDPKPGRRAARVRRPPVARRAVRPDG